MRRGNKETLAVQRNHSYDEQVNGHSSLEAKQTNDELCELEVSRDSAEKFSTEVLKHKYNFVYFNLSFNGVSVKEDDSVILYNRWIWTYKGDDGGHEYLFLPNDYGYLSFGLLWSYTQTKPILIQLAVKNGTNCSTLTGGGDADQKIGDALGNMTERIASLNDMYNSSYWCYSKRMYIESDIIFVACENAVCTIQTFAYSCCRFRLDFLTKERKVECERHHYHFGAVWWLLPILIGETLFAYYPLLLTSIGCSLRSFSRRRRRRSLRPEEMNSIDESEQLVRLSKHKPPVTFLSTICEPLGKCNIEGAVLSRLIRLTIIFLPLSLTVIRILLDYKYAGDLVNAAVNKGALVGFSTVLADFKSGTHYFLRFLGGPFVALPLFVVFGCILIVAPSNLEEMLVKGLIEFDGKSSFLLTLSTDSKAKLAGVQVGKTTGYKRVHKILLSQVLMLLNHVFWKQTFKLFLRRFTRVVYPMLRSLTRSSCVAVVVGVFLALIYVLFCLIELILTFSYFAFPVFSCFFILIRAFIKYTQEFFNFKTGMRKMLGHFLTVIITLVFAYTWYLYCLIFFDSFWFITKIVMFTYTGVIAFPKLSYGYLILALMALFYIGESFNNFRQNYQDLLYVSLKACKKVEETLENEHMEKRILCDGGLPSDLWNLIIEQHRPRRIQVTYTLFQLCAIISILTVSLDLLFRFDKFRDLSLITHVFTALIICALPKIAKSVCTSGVRYRQQKKMKMKIIRTVHDYLSNDKDTDEEDIYVFHDRSEYENLE